VGVLLPHASTKAHATSAAIMRPVVPSLLWFRPGALPPGVN
jgi:hypothetical protein